MAEPSQDPIGPLRALLQQFTGGGGMAAPRQGPAPAPAQQAAPAPTVPAVTAGSAGASPPPERTLLERLRESVAETATPSMSSADSLAAFAAGMGGPRRQGFVQDLLAGIQAQNQFEAGRRGEMRQSIEAQARLADQERKAALEKAKFAEETTPGTLSGRLTEARIRQADAAAAQAGRSNLQIVGTDEATGYVRAMDPRTGETRVLTGVRPTRSELAANAAEERIRGRALSNAARAVDEEMKLNPTLNRENRIRQLFPVYLELARSEERAASGGGGGGGSRLPTAPTESNPPPQRMQYQPPR